MSKATDYLVEQIRERDARIAEFRTRLETAWGEGWHEHYLEFERQKADPTHPITANNPFTKEQS